MLRPAQMPLESLLPNTTFFEFDSAAVGATLGVWVTTPLGYDPAGTERYPAIFTPDGNLLAPLSIPYVALLGGSVGGGGDVIFPIRPYLQITIGYSGSEGADASTRLRDLLPPGEPAPQHLLDVIEDWVAEGHWTREVAETAKRKISSARADAFLRFLVEELYPAVLDRWRIDPTTTGFFGDSYGGLFAVWMALQRVAEFPVVGAGSPGIASPESKIFELLEREIATGADHSGRRLHLSIPEPEISVASYFQMAAEQYVRMLGILGRTPLRGLTLTTHSVPFESHLTGILGNYFSFLRTCYPGA